jgi:hypothetical protein
MLPAHDDPAALAADILTLTRDPERLMERRRLVRQANDAIRHGPDHATVLRSVPRPTPRVRVERQARWARLVAAAIRPDPRPFHFGPGISFPMSGSTRDRQVLLDGWHWPEPWGRWTDGDEASMRITLASPATRGLTLEMDLIPSPVAATLSLTLDNFEFGPIQPVQGPNAWDIPPHVTRGKSNFMVRLRVSETICPAAAGGSSDTRILGTGVSSVRVRWPDAPGSMPPSRDGM